MKHAFFFYECDKYFTFTNMCEKDATKKKSGHVMLPKKNQVMCEWIPFLFLSHKNLKSLFRYGPSYSAKKYGPSYVTIFASQIIS